MAHPTPPTSRTTFPILQYTHTCTCISPNPLLHVHNPVPKYEIMGTGILESDQLTVGKDIHNERMYPVFEQGHLRDLQPLEDLHCEPDYRSAGGVAIAITSCSLPERQSGKVLFTVCGAC